jgi:MoxR-like ATPase
MSELASRLQSVIGQVLLGKDSAIELAITTLFAGGHLLIEDHPGVGKTLLARSLAKALDLPFQRVQCTSDLLPADILGAQVYQPMTGEITFRPGPVFTSVLLADELNRTPPRTQSALLECMAEGRVSLDRQVMELPQPYFVVATQNPMSAAGTYPLPENQLDRFLMRIRLGYPDPEHELRIVAQEDGHRAAADVVPVASREQVMAERAMVDKVQLSRELAAFIVELVGRTRSASEVHLGVSTRGAQAMHRACRARAVVHGRDYVVPDDVRALLLPVWGHRLTMRGGSGAAEALLHEILATTPMPD